MTKEEMQDKINDLEQELDDLNDYVADMESDIADLRDDLDNAEDELKQYKNCNEPIKDSEKFIERLKLDNLYSSELESFIERYLRFYND